MIEIDFTKCKGFQWDDGNREKNWHKHRVTCSECEQVFFNYPVVVRQDIDHSFANENRFYILGQTDHGRPLFIVFTIRDPLIRIISARDMSKKEIRIYKDVKD